MQHTVSILKTVVEKLAKKQKIPDGLDRYEIVNSLMMLLAFRMRGSPVKVLSPDDARITIPRDAKTGNIYITSFNLPGGHFTVNVTYVNSPHRKFNTVTSSTFQFSVKCGQTIDHHGDLFRPKWSGRVSHYEAKSYSPTNDQKEDICFLGLIHQVLFLADQLNQTDGDFKAAITKKKSRYTKPCTSKRLADCIRSAERDIHRDVFEQWYKSTENIHPGVIGRKAKVGYLVDQMLWVSDESAKNCRALKQHKKEFVELQSLVERNIVQIERVQEIDQQALRTHERLLQSMQSQIVALQNEVAALRGQDEDRDKQTHTYIVDHLKDWGTSNPTAYICPFCKMKTPDYGNMREHLTMEQMEREKHQAGPSRNKKRNHSL